MHKRASINAITGHDGAYPDGFFLDNGCEVQGTKRRFSFKNLLLDSSRLDGASRKLLDTSQLGAPS
jgi:GDP-D-mannose dehydratase